MLVLPFVLLSAVCCGVLATPHASKPTPVSLTLYYETLCPGCAEFVPTLLSTYTQKSYDFASLFSKLTLVPYGFVYPIDADKHKYLCQHGTSECLGNKLHGCAVNYVKDTVTLLNYVSCLEEAAQVHHNKTYYPVGECQEKISPDLYQTIMKCYNSDEGWDLFNKNGEITKAFLSGRAKAFVPYVSFNDKLDDDLASDALYDFRKVLCSLAGVVDKACSDNAGKGKRSYFKF